MDEVSKLKEIKQTWKRFNLAQGLGDGLKRNFNLTCVCK